MGEIAIRARQVSKVYTIGESGRRPVTKGSLAESLTDAATRPFKRLATAVRSAPVQREDDVTLWALNDVTFDVSHGDVVGIIGRNGAGKSTLLKILSRITDPTSGTIDVYGRIGSLLEVGSGFHQELTGRENIFLNGSILGMRQSEIHRKLDEIVAFAEIEKMIDTPVKHYSSGMYLRLAFSVAAHLEPEILLVDEVLAVGDISFQKKCMGKMGDVASRGRTVLFVSHNLAAIRELCRTAIVLKDGRVSFHGSVVQGLAKYTSSFLDDDSGPPNSHTGWHHVKINDQVGGAFTTVQSGDPFTIGAELSLARPCEHAMLFAIIEDSAGATAIHRRVSHRQLWDNGIPAGQHSIDVRIPPVWLTPGVFSVYFKFIGHAGTEDMKMTSERVTLDVTGDAEGISNAYLAPDVEWSVTTKNNNLPEPAATGRDL